MAPEETSGSATTHGRRASPAGPPPRSADRAEVDRSVDHLFRSQAARIVATLTRIFGIDHLELAEDVVQEALYKALRQWPYRGAPANPTAWITRVARNLALDALRRQGTWRSKEAALLHALPTVDRADPASELERERLDDQLAMVFACCHPSLARPSRIALTLKVASGFGVREIARALLVSEATVAQRVVRAKRRLRENRGDFGVPAAGELPRRLDSVLEVLYLMFNEGYASHEGEDLIRTELCHEARRLADLAAAHPATDLPETHALAALLHFQASRLPTRVDADGDLLLLVDQDRSRWDRRAMRLGSAALRRSARGERLTAYHLEAEISACHALAPDFGSTDWARILDCYDQLLGLKPSPIVAVNRLVPLARVRGARTALDAADALMKQPSLARYYPAWTTRAELLAQLGRLDEARVDLATALECATNRTVRRHLEKRQRELAAARR